MQCAADGEVSNAVNGDGSEAQPSEKLANAVSALSDTGLSLRPGTRPLPILNPLDTGAACGHSVLAADATPTTMGLFGKSSAAPRRHCVLVAGAIPTTCEMFGKSSAAPQEHCALAADATPYTLEFFCGYCSSAAFCRGGEAEMCESKDEFIVKASKVARLAVVASESCTAAGFSDISVENIIIGICVLSFTKHVSSLSTFEPNLAASSCSKLALSIGRHVADNWKGDCSASPSSRFSAVVEAYMCGICAASTRTCAASSGHVRLLLAHVAKGTSATSVATSVATSMPTSGTTCVVASVHTGIDSPKSCAVDDGATTVSADETADGKGIVKLLQFPSRDRRSIERLSCCAPSGTRTELVSRTAVLSVIIGRSSSTALVRRPWIFSSRPRA